MFCEEIRLKITQDKNKSAQSSDKKVGKKSDNIKDMFDSLHFAEYQLRFSW